MLTFPIDKTTQVKEAIMNYIDKSKDKKAAIVAAYRHFYIGGGQEVCLTPKVCCALTLIVDTGQDHCSTFL
jgi:hypothetical protein